jgi:hypothetical protein
MTVVVKISKGNLWMIKNIIIVFLLLCSPAYAVDAFKDGTIIMWAKNKGFFARAIKKHTGSNIIHASMLLYDGKNKPWVYESTAGGVQANPFDEHVEHLKVLSKKWPDLYIYVIEPINDYSPTELYNMKVYANSQLGRPYMLRGWWKMREVRGVHCSQYVGNILERSGRVRSKNYREAPIDVYKKALEMKVKK